MYFINSLWESILLKHLAAVFFPVKKIYLKFDVIRDIQENE